MLKSKGSIENSRMPNFGYDNGETRRVRSLGSLRACEYARTWNTELDIACTMLNYLSCLVIESYGEYHILRVGIGDNFVWVHGKNYIFAKCRYFQNAFTM